MKVKLLRKLRRRFHWFREKGHPAWYFYDRKKNKVYYSFVVGLFDLNDMLILELMTILGIENKFLSLRDRLRKKKTKKADLQLRDRFKEHFKK